MYLHVETSTGNDSLMVGVEGSVIFRADSSEGWEASGITWPLVITFSNGNIIGPLTESENVKYSTEAREVFESVAWDSGHATEATNPDSILLGLLDFDGDLWTSSGEVWRITFIPSDTGRISIDSGTIPPYGQVFPENHMEVISQTGSVPFAWGAATLYVMPFCPITVPGDVNLDSFVNSADIIGLVNFVFRTGASPRPCEASADVNCSQAITAADILFLVSHVFRGGPPPCAVCALIYAGLWECP